MRRSLYWQLFIQLYFIAGSQLSQLQYNTSTPAHLWESPTNNHSNLNGTVTWLSGASCSHQFSELPSISQAGDAELRNRSPSKLAQEVLGKQGMTAGKIAWAARRSSYGDKSMLKHERVRETPWTGWSKSSEIKSGIQLETERLIINIRDWQHSDIWRYFVKMG